MTTSEPVSIQPHGDEGVVVWLLKRRHEEFSEMFRAAWDNYIKFYTVFLTFSLGAMGWLLAQTGNQSLPARVKHVIAIVFIAQSLLCSITSAGLGLYSHKVGADQARSEADILGSLVVAPVMRKVQSIPVALGIWAGCANAAAMLGMLFAWFYIGFLSS